MSDECECCADSQPCPAPPSSPPPPGCALFPGDVDSDDATSVLDVAIVVSNVTGVAGLPEEASCAADVDSNGVINVGVSAIRAKNKRRERERESRRRRLMSVPGHAQLAFQPLNSGSMHGRISSP